MPEAPSSDGAFLKKGVIKLTINDIYEEALYLAEKTDDATGYIDDEYRKHHREKGERLIKHAIRYFSHLEGLTNIDPDFFSSLDEIPLDNYVLKNIIPCFVAAMLCAYDRENDKYNLLIYEYQMLLNGYKHYESSPDYSDILEGMC